MNWIQPHIESYFDWIKDNTAIISDTGTDWVAIETPFIGAFNDNIELYVKQNTDGSMTLSDDGQTLHKLDLQGVNIQGSKKRKEVLNSLLLNYGVKQTGSELSIIATPKDFGQKKHSLLSAVLEIGDMYLLAKPNVSSFFKEDVEAYLSSLDIIFTPDYIAKGETGLDFTFDFQIAAKDSETVIKSFNSITQTTLSTFLFSWEDIRPVRQNLSKKDVHAIAVINDGSKKVNPDYLEALKAKEASVVLWSKKSGLREVLKAA